MSSREEYPKLIVTTKEIPLLMEQIKPHLICLKRIRENYLLDGISTEEQKEHLIITWDYLKIVLIKILSPRLMGMEQLPYMLTQLTIESFTGIYPVLFKYIVDNPEPNNNNINTKQLWDELSQFKELLLSKWPSSFPLPFTNTETQLYQSQGCMEALTKLMSELIQVQTRGEDSSTNHLDYNHPFLNLKALQTESQMLIDKMIGLLSDDLLLPTTMFSTILSCLISLFKTRPLFITQRFLNIVLAYESQFKSAPKFPLHPNNVKIQNRITRKFNDRLDKILLSLLFNRGFLNSGPQLPFKQRFEKKLKFMSDRDAQIKQRKISITTDKWDSFFNDDKDDENSDLHKFKKRKLNSSNSTFFNESPIPSENNWSSLYTLIRPENELNTFDMNTIDPNYLASMVLLGLAKADTASLVKALGIVENRYKWINEPAKASTDDVKKEDLVKKEHANDENSDLTNIKQEIKKEEIQVDEDNDSEYDPTIATTSIKMEEPVKQEIMDLDETKVFELPLPEKLDGIDNRDTIKILVDDILTSLPKTIPNMGTIGIIQEKNSNKLESSLIPQWNNQSPLIVLIRLATRGLNENNSVYIRDELLSYFKQDLKLKINGLLWWLSEEWYSYYKLGINKKTEASEEESPYLRYLKLVMDYFISFIEMSDRSLFIRFLSELPLLPLSVLGKVKAICLDPMRMKLGFQSLLFLMMFRPPIVEDCKSLLNDIKEHSAKTGNEQAVNESNNLLKKFI